MNTKPQTIIFVGRSGSGKGTQIDLLKKYLETQDKDIKIREIVMGNIFRNFFNGDSFVQKMAKEVTMEKGQFQPDFLTNALFINEAVMQAEEEAILFFDGFPRSLDQLNIIKQFLTYIKREKPIVVNIDVSRKSVKERMLLRQRADDKDQAIDKRLDEFDRLTHPMIEEIKRDSFFRYLEIDGEGTIEEIHYNLIKELNI
ncbi:MAG TPA: nucleoside monophosphate kinase [Candidatus Paceibacterota bacterium]|nr:nucleoside monophosphate kinase [Candidatus Paceibacterota bacterium]